MSRTNKRKKDDNVTQNIWRSYSDMMSGLLLLFVLIMAVCLMQAQKNYTEKLAEQAKQIQTQNELEASQSQVNDQQAQLEAQQTQLDEQQAQLAEQELTLAEQASALELMQKALENQQLVLNEKESELDAKDAELTAKDAQLEQQQSELDQKESELEDSRTALLDANELMQAQQTRIDQIIGVKADLIAELNNEFQKNNIDVQIDTQTGAILLNSNVLFDFNMYVLTAIGTDELDKILPIYCKVLLSGQYADYVAEVIIDGYTDTSGDYVTNMQLSQNRAFAVGEYLLNMADSFLSPAEQEMLKAKLSVNGKSMSHPVYSADGTIDMDASRRVEIKFRLKDEEMMTELQQLISSSTSQTADAVARAQEEEAAG